MKKHAKIADREKKT